MTEQTTQSIPLAEETTGLARPELIQVADAVARADRSIPGAFTESDLSSGSRLIIDQSATR